MNAFSGASRRFQAARLTRLDVSTAGRHEEEAGVYTAAATILACHGGTVSWTYSLPNFAISFRRIDSFQAGTGVVEVFPDWRRRLPLCRGSSCRMRWPWASKPEKRESVFNMTG